MCSPCVARVEPLQTRKLESNYKMSSSTEKLNQEIYQSAKESPEATDAEIFGVIPKWIEGSFIRVGPGKFEWGDTEYNHWFDGDAILNKFEIKDGNVKFSSRFLRSNSYVESEKRGCIAFTHFGTLAPPDPCKNIFNRFSSHFSAKKESSDNCNVNIIKFEDEIYAVSDFMQMWKIDRESLESVGTLDLSIKITGPRSWISHPHYDEAGSHLNCSADFDRKVYEIINIPQEKDENNNDDDIKVVASIPYEGDRAYMHSFSITENHFILIEGSLMWREKMESEKLSLTPSDLLYFDKEKKSKLHVIDRKSGKVGAVYQVEPFMSYHQINAYEMADEIVFDTCCYPDSSVIDDLYLHNLRSGKTKAIFPAEVRRYHLPLTHFNIEKPVTTDLKKEPSGHDYVSIYQRFEMPRINYAAFNGKKYRFAYGTGNSAIQAGLTTLIKRIVPMRGSNPYCMGTLGTGERPT